MPAIEEIIEQRAKTVAAVSLDVTLIDRSPFQARKRFDPEGLASLAEGIKKQLLNAIYVRQVGTRFELIAGERRWRAVKDVLKWTHIDAKVITCSDQEAAELCTEENFERVDLLPSEKARQIKILQELGVPLERIAKRAGSVDKMEMWLKVADLPEGVQTMLDNRQIKMTTVSILSNIDGPQHQLRAAEMAQTGQLTKTELQARTQHLPQRTPVRAASITTTKPPAMTLDKLHRELINLQQELGHFSVTTLTAAQKIVLRRNSTNLIVTLRAFVDQIDS